MQTNSYDTGDGGKLTVGATESVLISGSSRLTSNAVSGRGTGGSILLSAPSLVMEDRGSIQAGTLSDGNAGEITVHVGSLTMRGGAFITVNSQGGAAESQGGAGESGKLTVAATEAVSISGPSSGIASNAFLSSRKGGDILLSAPSLTMADGATIQTMTGSKGRAGDTTVEVGNLTLTGGAFIVTSSLASSLGAGDGGNLTVSAAESISISGPSSGLASNALSGGTGGNIFLTASSLKMEDNASIQTMTSGNGSAGDTTVVVGNLALTGGASINTGTVGVGHGGQLTVTAAGSVFISGKNHDGFRSSFRSDAASSGPGGNIELRAKEVQLSQGGSITAQSTWTGSAGNIRITAQNTFQSQNGRVTTEARQSGGGNIELYAGSRAHLIDSQITTTVQGGTGDAGNITLQGTQQGGGSGSPTRFVVLNDSQLTAMAFEGRGGNIRIAAGMFLADPGSLVDASSRLGIDGTIDIRAPVTQISGSLAPLSKEFLSAGGLLRERCAERIGGGRLSSLVVGGRDGLPIEPGDPLPSPIFREGETMAGSPADGVGLRVPAASSLDPVDSDAWTLLPVEEWKEMRKRTDNRGKRWRWAAPCGGGKGEKAPKRPR